MGSRKKMFRVSKIDTKKGRGRPQAYPESWKKKVIVLRSCGLDLKDILEMLAEQDGLAFQAKIRRSQQIVQELLADERGRFIPPDKITARRMAAFIRAKPRNGEQRAPLQSNHPPTGVFASPATKTSTPNLSDQSMGLMKQSPNMAASPEVISNRQNQTPQIDRDMGISNNCTECGSVDQSSHLCWGPNMVAQKSSVLHEETLHNLNQIGQRFSTTDRILANLKRLSNTSYSSSFWSDIVSLMGRRYSWSSFGSADRYSVSALSESTTEDQSLEDRVKKALRLRQQEDIKEMENKVLVQRCCKKNGSCIHKAIMELAKGDLESLYTSKSKLNYLLWFYDNSSSIIDKHKNDELFFAARVGAPADVILTLMKAAVNPDFINNNGQTWLHCLDPRLLSVRGCCCGHLPTHSTKFECIFECIMFTISPAFQFDRIDDHGRHFLFYICSSSTFDLSLLAELVQRDTDWAKRVVSASQIRDRAGLFLLDYISMHPGFSELSEDMRLLLQPNFDPDSHSSRILQDEDNKGRTDLHIHMEKAIFADVHPALRMPFDDAIIRRQINRYDDTGHTPIMTLVEEAFKSGQEESILCDRVRQLAASGANVNARSRSGATILHFAAKKAAAQLLDVLLGQLGARVDACDDKGCSATDCVTNIIKLSQSSKRPAELLARSIKSAVKILAVTSGQSETSRKNPAITVSHTVEADRPLKEMLQRLRKPNNLEDHVSSQLRRSYQGTI